MDGIHSKNRKHLTVWWNTAQTILQKGGVCSNTCVISKCTYQLSELIKKNHESFSGFTIETISMFLRQHVFNDPGYNVSF